MSNITMKEIAKLARVSQPTVSRVLNGDKRVREDMAKRVLEAIDAVGYIPNKTAQTLKRSHSNIIGVCVPDINNPYFVELIEILELEARKKGYNILFHNSRHNPITEWESIQNFISRQVDGFLIVPTGDYNIQRINELNIPAVVITQSIKDLDSVGLNHILAGRLAGENFIHSGHKKFGYIGKNTDSKFLGYESSLYENGFKFDQKNYIKIHEASTNSFLIRRDIENFFAQTEHIDFTCAFTTNDITALEFIRVAQERNIQVPDDVSIIGFDDTYLAKIMGISSIHQPIEEMIKTSIEILLDRIKNKTPSELLSIQLEPTLIERRSSKISRKFI